MGGNASGLPDWFRGEQEARHIGQHADRRTDWSLPCDDPGVRGVALAFAQALRESRPVVTLPPHIYIPFRGRPWNVEDRRILDGTDGNAATGAEEAGIAEGLPVVVETTDFSDLASFTVPSGFVAVLKKIAFDTDDLGWFAPEAVGGTAMGLAAVRFRLSLGNDLTLLPPPGASFGLQGTMERPIEVAYIVPERMTIAVQGISSDTVIWHLVESYLEGYLVPTSEINDAYSSLLDERSSTPADIRRRPC